jgi:hypothetical protein
MSQNRVIVTSERSDDHDDQIQDTIDRIAAVNAGTTGIATANWQTKLTDAQAAQTAVSTRAPGTAKTRNDTFREMFEEEDKVIALLQGKVDDLAGSIDAKIALALSNGFTVKDFGTINKQDFVVVDGPISGSVKQVAKASEQNSFHEWDYSLDNGVTWTYILSTIQASRITDGFTPGQKVKFRHRMFLRTGPGDYHYAELIIR